MNILIRLRESLIRFLILKLAGNRTVIINATIYYGLVHVSEDGFVHKCDIHACEIIGFAHGGYTSDSVISNTLLSKP